MDDLWIKKYRPESLSEVIGNSSQIQTISNWLVNFDKMKYSSIIISGNHGIGKTVSIKLLAHALNYNIKLLNSNNSKNQKAIDDLLKSTVYTNNIKNMIDGTETKRIIVVIDDTETVTLNAEKSSIIELYKTNEKYKFFPILFISSLQHSKLISKIKETCVEIKFSNPNKRDLIKLINHILDNEKLCIDDDKIKEKIIMYSQGDIRRLIIILQDLYFTFHDEQITAERLKEYCDTTQKKDMDMGLFLATNKILDSYKNPNTCLQLFEMEKVLLPLMVQENYYSSVFSKYNDPAKILEIVSNVSDSISQGEVIETTIYTDQNWYLQNIHGFFTCVQTSYELNKYPYNSLLKNYDCKFTNDFTKTSLKNINKKNISNLQLVFPKKSINDVLSINKIIYNLIKNNDQDKIREIVKYYNLSPKIINVIIKIDKTVDEKLVVSTKMKNLITELNKAAANV
ncbi:MAG: replication factor C large subunit [Faunusvirus sp.]|jgi:replication factor C subunit 1|uniref:Replication factor C large subunit n=1 Tax=Faunusvirus sp. TaxID=2487766 RepID=A0A3G4ZWJ8_9VIRU|nr:MAG: replication factor C large subunit [Faunusvirus sp.]